MSTFERVMVFIDGSNTYRASQAFEQGFVIDYRKLVDELAGERYLVRPYFYAGVGEPPNPDQIRFHHRLKYLGIDVVTRPYWVKATRCRACNNLITENVEKASDIALVVDMLSMANRGVYDTAILVGGDRDMAGALEVVKGMGRRVEIAAFDRAIGEDLKMIADRFIPLDSIVDNIRLIPV